MLHKEASQAAKRFGPRRARRFTREIWEHMRWMDTPALDRAVEAAAAMLRAGGIQDVRIERLPADGKTCAGGWLMPLAWSVSSARLEIVGGSGAPIELVDHTRDPQAVAPWSPGTPRGRWVTGDVVSIASADARLPRDLSGRYVFLTEGRGCERLNARAAARGAAGILTTRHGQYPDASRFENAAVPKDPDTPCVPSYALSPRAGDVLQAALAHDKHLQIRGKVRARRYAGTVPLLTGSIGSGGPPIYVCGHIDEIGALDNASGCATGIEALCVLQKLMTVRGLQPQRRQIRFFFSTEIRGIQMWLNQQAQMPTFFGGINLDMTGADPIREPSTMQVLTGFQHRPHFSAHLLREAVSIADKCVGGMPWRERRNFVSDGMFGIHHLQGHVSLEQATGESYHTSADTPAVLSDRAFRWSGTATVAYLYLLSRLGSREALQLGRRIQDAVMQSGQKGAVQTTRLRRAQIELQTLMPALDDHNRPRGGLASVEAWYTAGVKRATGCWPDIERANDMRQMISEIGTRLARRTPLRLQAPAALQRRAQALVPAACFRGFLSFEDHVTSHARKRLQASTGLSVSWGTASWAWMLATCFRGKQSLLEIVNDLAVLGVTVPLDRAIGLTEHLESRGQIRLRPVITATALRRCLRALGVKRGSILVVHASLSDYGYMQGGSQMVIDTLRSILGPKGTLLMPTHSNSELGMPAYTPRDSPSNTGAVTEYFRKLLFSLHLDDIISSIVKSIVFGIIISVVSIYYGFKVEQSTTEIPVNTIKAVGMSFVLCILADALIVLIYYT